ncbi:unnamed protein product [Dovyalis caffra]|uniref:Uncharacterized protein n=1 Tax=Dovyalis caffra TaxID=77055 RepID=A0AAV1SD96_9ROSI|nr:unnamed protein product [Dovyalis caffra]
MEVEEEEDNGASLHTGRVRGSGRYALVGRVWVRVHEGYHGDAVLQDWMKKMNRGLGPEKSLVFTSGRKIKTRLGDILNLTGHNKCVSDTWIQTGKNALCDNIQ